MRWKSHVRFGGRAAETHLSKDWQGAAVRPLHRTPHHREQAPSLRAIKDMHSGRIVGYSINSRMTASLAVSALRNAIRLREPAGTIVHPERGSQYRSRKLVNTLLRNDLPGSMDRVGACGDNAAMKSFFTPAAKQRPEPATPADPRGTTPGHRDLNRTHHRRRHQTRLGTLTPIE
jgi:putative transposase